MKKIVLSLLCVPLFVSAGREMDQEIRAACKIVAQHRSVPRRRAEAYCVHLMIRDNKTCQEACADMMSMPGLLYAVNALAGVHRLPYFGPSKRSVGEHGSVTTRCTLSNITPEDACPDNEELEPGEKNASRYPYAQNGMTLGDFLPASLT
jgi:hypothetical protein